MIQVRTPLGRSMISSEKPPRPTTRSAHIIELSYRRFLQPNRSILKALQEALKASQSLEAALYQTKRHFNSVDNIILQWHNELIEFDKVLEHEALDRLHGAGVERLKALLNLSKPWVLYDDDSEDERQFVYTVTLRGPCSL